MVQFNDYIESINQYTAGAFDGCTMTNMDALTIPAAGGVDSTALIVGDFSNGNDGIVLKGADKALADLRGQNVNLVELSVSHYLLARALASVDMTERDLTVVNTSDADIVAAFSTDDVTSVVTWNPLLAEVTGLPDVSPVFDSSMIPGEIIDMLVVSTEAAKDERLGKALVGAWYETMAAMSSEGAGRGCREDPDGRGIRYRPCGLQRATGGDADVLHRGARRGVRTLGCAARNHGECGCVLVRSTDYSAKAPRTPGSSA